jgi:hypothetical protein
MKIVEKVLSSVLVVALIFVACFIGYKWSEYKLEMLYGIENPTPKQIMFDMMR